MVKARLLMLPLILSLILIGCAGLSEPSVEQIKADLIGQRIYTSALSGWEFEALSEFEQFDIRGKQRQGDVIEFDVSMRLQDLSNDTHFLADVLILYKKADGKWELTSIVPKLFRQL